MERTKASEASHRPRRGGMALAASLGLLVLFSACVPTHGQFPGLKRAYSRLHHRLVGPESKRELSGTSSGCDLVTVDFNTAADGTVIPGGTYIDTQYVGLGMTFFAEGGVGDKPRAFNTPNPGTMECGDPDLGSPNERCSPPGPGIGEGGEPGMPGENCEALGNVLIIQEVGMVPHTHHLGVSGSFLKGYFRVEVSHALKDFLHYISAHNKSHSICNVAYGWSKSTPYCFQFSYNCSPICHE